MQAPLTESVSVPDRILEYERGKRLTDRGAIGVLCDACGCTHVQEIGGWETKQKIDAIMHYSEAS